MQVHYDEGVAVHIGPEPCVVVREGRGEASAGERIGQPLSRERIIPDADAVHRVEGSTGGRVNAHYGDPPIFTDSVDRSGATDELVASWRVS